MEICYVQQASGQLIGYGVSGSRYVEHSDTSLCVGEVGATNP